MLKSVLKAEGIWYNFFKPGKMTHLLRKNISDYFQKPKENPSGQTRNKVNSQNKF